MGGVGIKEQKKKWKIIWKKEKSHSGTRNDE